MPEASIIIPTCNRYDVLLANIAKLKTQSFADFEIIVCDDSTPQYRDSNLELLDKVKKDCLYFYTARFDERGNKFYGLAGARNKGIVEANSKYLMFLDDRISPNPNALSIFIDKFRHSKKDKVWYFGNKGKDKIAFVENFSAILRHHIIDAGMFCERIEKYGAMTRELIARYIHQGFRFEYVPEAIATWIIESRDRARKEQEIPEMREFLKKLGYAK